MIEEFLLLLESGKEKALGVLRPQIRPEILKYLIGGFFDQNEKRMVAYAIMAVDKSFYNERGHIFDFFSGSCSMEQSTKTSERIRIYYDDHSFSYKSIEKCIEEGLYYHLLISFFCEFDFNEWNILQEHRFSDNKNKQVVLKNALPNVIRSIKDYVFNSSIFEETEKYHNDLNSFFEKAREQHENSNFQRGILKMELPTEDKPFVGHSHLVALIRTEKKRKINQTFKAYIGKAIVEPLVVKLKTVHPDSYQRVHGIYSEFCEILFPDHKRFCLLICFVVNKKRTKRLQFFVYRQESDHVYEWAYFPPSAYKKSKVESFTIYEMFEPISKFDNMDYLYKPECTLDDDNFWNNYVFKKENDEYVYLKEISF